MPAESMNSISVIDGGRGILVETPREVRGGVATAAMAGSALPARARHTVAVERIRRMLEHYYFT